MSERCPECKSETGCYVKIMYNRLKNITSQGDVEILAQASNCPSIKQEAEANRNCKDNNKIISIKNGETIDLVDQA